MLVIVNINVSGSVPPCDLTKFGYLLFAQRALPVTPCRDASSLPSSPRAAAAHDACPWPQKSHVDAEDLNFPQSPQWLHSGKCCSGPMIIQWYMCYEYAMIPPASTIQKKKHPIHKNQKKASAKVKIWWFWTVGSCWISLQFCGRWSVDAFLGSHGCQRIKGSGQWIARWRQSINTATWPAATNCHQLRYTRCRWDTTR